MANRRCFSKDIVCSDDFYDLPISSQALYFHLGMQADDRGYVNNTRSIIKITGSSVGDLEQLVSKKFVLVREQNLILIKGWRINNTIQPSRMVETKYTDDLKKLFFDENNSYTEKETNNPCQQIVDIVSTQDNLIKDKIIKDNISKDKVIEDKSNISIKELNPFTLPLVQYLKEQKYITNTLEETGITLAIEKLLNKGNDPIKIKSYLVDFTAHIKDVDLDDIDNRANYLSDYLTDATDTDDLPF